MLKGLFINKYQLKIDLAEGESLANGFIRPMVKKSIGNLADKIFSDEHLNEGAPGSIAFVVDKVHDSVNAEITALLLEPGDKGFAWTAEEAIFGKIINSNNLAGISVAVKMKLIIL